MNGLVDTLLNIEVFAFIGLLIWLYVKPDAASSAGEIDPNHHTEVAGNSE